MSGRSPQQQLHKKGLNKLGVAINSTNNTERKSSKKDFSKSNRNKGQSQG